MKAVIDLEKNLREEEIFESQIEYQHDDCNILYVSPYKNAKGVYKYIQPSILMMDDDIAAVAYTSIEKYDETKQYEEIDSPITSAQIQWADIIVIPFTTQPLYSKDPTQSLITTLKRINPSVRVVYNVDFNFYKVPKDHVQHSLFNKNTVKNIEDNIFYSDLTLCSNMLLVDFLNTKIQQLKKTRYKGVETPARISSFPILIDAPLFIENVLQNEPKKAPQTEADNIRVGIIATPNSFEDIKAFSKQLEEAKNKLGDKFELVVLGFDCVSPKNKRSAFSKDFDFKYVPPCSIIHYMRQLDMLTLDAIFIPLRFNEFNTTSEDYNKLLEASVFAIPVIAPNIFPYNEIIKNGETGIVLEKKNDLVGILENMGMKKAQFSKMGQNLQKFVEQSFSCHEINIKMVKAILRGVDVKKYLHNEVEEKHLEDNDERMKAEKEAQIAAAEAHIAAEKAAHKAKTNTTPKQSDKKSVKTAANNTVDKPTKTNTKNTKKPAASKSSSPTKGTANKGKQSAKSAPKNKEQNPPKNEKKS